MLSWTKIDFPWIFLTFAVILPSETQTLNKNPKTQSNWRNATHSANSAATRDKNLGLHLSSEDEFKSISLTCKNKLKNSESGIVDNTVMYLLKHVSDISLHWVCNISVCQSLLFPQHWEWITAYFYFLPNEFKLTTGYPFQKDHICPDPQFAQQSSVCFPGSQCNYLRQAQNSDILISSLVSLKLWTLTVTEAHCIRHSCKTQTGRA